MRVIRSAVVKSDHEAAARLDAVPEQPSICNSRPLRIIELVPVTCQFGLESTIPKCLEDPGAGELFQRTNPVNRSIACCSQPNRAAAIVEQLAGREVGLQRCALPCEVGEPT